MKYIYLLLYNNNRLFVVNPYFICTLLPLVPPTLLLSILNVKSYFLKIIFLMPFFLFKVISPYKGSGYNILRCLNKKEIVRALVFKSLNFAVYYFE